MRVRETVVDDVCSSTPKPLLWFIASRRREGWVFRYRGPRAKNELTAIWCWATNAGGVGAGLELFGNGRCAVIGEALPFGSSRLLVLTGIVSSRTAPVIVLGPSAPDLASRIEAFWSLQGSGQERHSFHDFFADGNANLIVRLSPSGCRAVLLGPVTARAVVERDEQAEYLGLRFRLGQTPSLVDASTVSLTNEHVELTQIGRQRLDDLAERLLREREPVGRQRLVEELVRPLPCMVRSARARKLASVMESNCGALSVDELANQFGLGVRSLERLCLAELGVSPKRLQRIVRLRHVLRRMHAGNYGTLANVAQVCGYTDQSHLIKDFKDLTGRLPGEPRAFAPRQLDGAPQTAIVHRYRNCP